MVEMESMSMEARELPAKIDCYRICPDGRVVVCNAVTADVYISEFSVQYFSDKEAMLHILKTYGEHIGVMRDTAYTVQAREYRTPKMLLGVVKGIS